MDPCNLMAFAFLLAFLASCAVDASREEFACVHSHSAHAQKELPRLQRNVLKVLAQLLLSFNADLSTSGGILVINRRSRLDRRKWMQVGVDALRQAGWDAQFVEACDLDDVKFDAGAARGSLHGVEHASYTASCCDETIDGIKRDFDALGAEWDWEQLKEWYGRPVNGGEAALVHSNLKCLKLVLEKDWEWALILEDDCVPKDPDVADVVADGSWQQPDGHKIVKTAWTGMMSEFQCSLTELEELGISHCDFINLGPNSQSGHRGMVSEALARSGYDYGTQSVFYSRSAVQSIVDRSERLLAALIPWDDMLAVLQLGEAHPLEWGRKVWQHRYGQENEQPLVALSAVFPFTDQFLVGTNNSMAISDITYMDYRNILTQQLR